MQNISSTKLFSGLLLFACIVQACYTATVSNSNSAANRQLMCYVCEDCAKVTKETPLEACDAAYFEKLSTTEEPTTDPTITTTATSTEVTADSSTTTELSTTTSSSDETTTAGSTTEAVPTPPTVGPAPTTTTVPTPPTAGTAVAAAEEIEMADGADNATTTPTTTSTESALNATTTDAPQALPYVADDYSYHCFSVQKMVNGTASVDRGCSRVTTMESVCGQLRALNNGTQLSKCVPCSNSSCNGSSALGVSVAALLFTLVAVLLSRQ